MCIRDRLCPEPGGPARQHVTCARRGQGGAARRIDAGHPPRRRDDRAGPLEHHGGSAVRRESLCGRESVLLDLGGGDAQPSRRFQRMWRQQRGQAPVAAPLQDVYKRQTFPITSSRRCPRAPGFISRSKSTTAYGPRAWPGSSRCEPDAVQSGPIPLTRSKPITTDPLSEPPQRKSRPVFQQAGSSIVWCPEEDSNLHAVKR